MAWIPTRRDFVKSLAAGSASCGLPLLSNGSRESWLAAADGTAATESAVAGRNAWETEIRKRALASLQQRRLDVDYYRIGRRIAYPLPVPSLLVPDLPVPGIPDYPWSIWLLWTLEQRIMSLGWAAEWFHDEAARKAAASDLAALAQWPEYRQFARPDLSSAHAARILWTASTCWRGVDDDLRRDLREACRRHVESVLPQSDKIYGSISTSEDVLHSTAAHALIQNIPVIGTIGAALTARIVEHPATAKLDGRVKALLGATLDLRAKGVTEGVAYDGYVLDFVEDWLGTLPEKDRSPILEHRCFDQYLDEAYMLGAPGAAEQVAELSDVEPKEMPFHFSAQAKLLRLRPDPKRAWLMARLPAGWLRSDALAALREVRDELPRETPPVGALDAHYAAVLRSGWKADDLAVAVSCSESPMDHIQRDNGTLVVGTRGHWLIADPGYQQYAPGDDRQFTVGPVAHNAPLVNGFAQTQKRPRRIVLEDLSQGEHHVAIDLTACYPPASSLKTFVRHVWLSGNNLIVVADEIEATSPPRLTYHWHGHAACAWWIEADWALITLDGARLWFACADAHISGANLLRLPGSRGQLSLVSSFDAAGPVVWWAFVLGSDRPVLRTGSEGRQLHVLDKTFRV